jgi:hypothetical protein
MAALGRLGETRRRVVAIPASCPNFGGQVPANKGESTGQAAASAASSPP